MAEALAPTTTTWWRPDARVAAPVSMTTTGGRVAFGALVAFTAILLLSPQAFLPALKSLRIAFVASGIAILAHLLDRAVTRQRLSPLHREMAIAIALVAWAVVTIPLSFWPGGSIEELTEHFLKAVTFAWLIGAIVTTREQLRRFVWVLVLCTIPLAITAIVNFQSGVFLQTPSRLVQRIAGYNDGGSGLAANPNDLALVLNLIIPLAAMLAVSDRGVITRIVATAIVLLSATAVVLTFSRAGFLALGSTGLLLLIMLIRRQPLGALALVLVVGLGAPALAPEGYMSRIATIANTQADPTGSAQGRWGDIEVSTDIVAKHPITGVGLGQNILALNQMRGKTWRAVHNVYLQYAVDLGIPGLVLFLWLFAAVFAAARRVRKRSMPVPARRDLGYLAAGVQIALVAFAVSAFFYPSAYQFYFFTLAGLATALKNACGARCATTAAAKVAA
jgi:O-antigen ligase